MTRPVLFIGGIPTAGKSTLAVQLAAECDGVVIHLDNWREELRNDPALAGWVDFFWNQDEAAYWRDANPDDEWRHMVDQQEALWPSLSARLKQAIYAKPTIVEGVSILPHFIATDFPGVPGLFLLGESLEDTLKRNRERPRWSQDPAHQEYEARAFFEWEGPRLQAEADAYGYPAFRSQVQALEEARRFLTGG